MAEQVVGRLIREVFEDSFESRRLVALVLYASFIPLAIAVVVSRGALHRPWPFIVGTAMLMAQLIYCAVSARIGDVAAAVLTVAVPATYVVYVLAAPRADVGLWPCLVLPVLWCAVFLGRPMVAASVVLNAIASVAGLTLESHAAALHITLEALTRVGVLTVAAVIVHGLVGHLRQARDASRQAAETLQAGLLPTSLPSIPSLLVSAFYQPAGVGQQVGGDFYDVFAAGDGLYVLLLGDVQGKDLAAARLTGLVRHTARALASFLAEPDAVVSALNDVLLSEDQDRFCSLVYATLAVADGATLRLVSAGHPLPLRRSAHGVVAEIGQRGPLLGVTSGADFPVTEYQIEVCETVVCFSDGLIDARDGTGFVGEDGVRSAVAVTDPSRSADVAHAIWRQISSSAQPVDDIAILALARTSRNSDDAGGRNAP